MPAQAGNSLNITAAGIVVFDGTATFTADTVTQYDTLVGGASNTISNIAPGTLGWVLTSGGAAANPAYAALPYTPIPWTDKAVSFNAAAGNGYFVTAVATATLPAGTQGAIVSFVVDNAAALTIQAPALVLIRIGKAVSAAAGIAVNNFVGDSVTLVFRAVDSTWIATDVVGTWTVT
jgi:hypothetical protein